MGNKNQVVIKKKKSETPQSPEANMLISDLRHSLCRYYSGTVTVNISLTFSYWQVGIRINTEILKNHRAEYGKQILATVSQQLGLSNFKDTIHIYNPLKKIRSTEFFEQFDITNMLEPAIKNCLEACGYGK